MPKSQTFALMIACWVEGFGFGQSSARRPVVGSGEIKAEVDGALGGEVGAGMVDVA
jgi:hypothetical protein